MREYVASATKDHHFLPNTTDWLGRWRIMADMSNDFMTDRAIQKTESYTGFDGVQVQDQAVQTSMAAIVDRAMEHLACQAGARGGFFVAPKGENWLSAYADQLAATPLKAAE